MKRTLLALLAVLITLPLAAAAQDELTPEEQRLLAEEPAEPGIDPAVTTRTA